MRPALLVVMLVGVSSASLCDKEGCACHAAGSWLNITCEFDSKQMVEVGPGAVPPSTLELTLTGARELRLLEDALSGARRLSSVTLRAAGRLQLRRHCFRGAGGALAHLQVSRCGAVVVESHAFRGAAAPLSARLEACAHVVLQGSAFSWLLAVEVRDVPRLELAGHAFAFESRAAGRHGPATTVLLHNVIVPELPPHAFPSSAARLELRRVEARAVRRDAFSAVALSSVLVQDSALHVVEEGAFSAKTLVEQLQLSRVHIRELRQGAVRAGVTNLTIQHSNVSEVGPGALNITVATVQLSDNHFGVVRSGGLVLKNWNRARLDGNSFGELETDALSLPFAPTAGVYSYEFSFSGNALGLLRPGSLGFAAEALAAAPALAARVVDNVFSEACRCDLAAWVRDVACGGRGDPRQLFESALCVVGEALEHCLGLPGGSARAGNFTEQVCGARDVILCEEGAGRREPVAAGADGERTVLGLVFVAVVCGMAAVLVATAVLWLRRRGHLALQPLLSRLCHSRLAAAASARSISRLSAREYAELQRRAGEDLVPCENKWTQTLPEELTQELLESLKERLDDPDRCGEARDVIEQLYDLIKIEESCGNNNDEGRGENVYDVIRTAARTTCSVGTRAPSPDKLLPPRLAGEYAEPRDREQHEYTELPAVRPLSFLRALAAVCEYAEPSDAAVHEYTELPACARMARRPLPQEPCEDPGEGPSSR
ncbi:uncharacterized protein LOC134538842 isoform X2 [Bacillus rossius redtenbacheri]|uniref:uncharacterized protein LOC134538842 isoform X2 n=1 Tax=Bacillus rossius redtenbacheri TaxID=93214 RepID=UPI002FDCCA27